MQGNNPGQGSSGGNNPKQSGLSWAQPVSPNQGGPVAANTPAASGGGSKPAVPAVPPATATKTSAPVASNTKASKAAPAQNASNSVRTFGLVAGGVVVAGLLIWGITSLAPSAQDDGTIAAGDSDTPAGENEGTDSVLQNIGSAGIGRSASASFTAATQEAGNQVVVSPTKVSAPTWLVVYEMAGGAPMWILGAAMVFPESSGQVAIDLLRPTRAGETYLIAQSPDMGDDHLFTRGQDVPLRDAGGKLLGVSFSTR